MITPDERASIGARAYVLEHLPSYVSAITGAEPHLVDDHVLYVGGEALIVIGYPLDATPDARRLDSVLRDAVARFQPRVLTVAAPAVPAMLAAGEREAADRYYRLDLRGFAPPPKVRHMLRRARREVEVRRGSRFGREHRRLVRAFLRARRPDEGTRFVLERLGGYLDSETARLYEARDAKGRLVAFDVADFGARDCAFYAFNFRSRRRPAPGASDLLLHRLVVEAVAEGRSSLGLGLGISPGVAFFKAKWGGVPYLRHVASRLDGPA